MVCVCGYLYGALTPQRRGERPCGQKMKTEVEDPDLVDTFTADSRGRIRLGKRFADREVKVAVEDRGQKEDTNDE